MAQDHISRIIADTRQFDAKITASMRVLQSLNQYILEVGSSNAQFSDTEKAVISGLGQMEASAKTTAGAVKQLSAVLNEANILYKKLDDDTKSGDVGKSLSKGIDDLRSRILQAKRDAGMLKSYVSPDTFVITNKKKAYVSPVTNYPKVKTWRDSVLPDDYGNEIVAQQEASSKNLFNSILGGNLAARAVMDSLRELKNVTKEAIQTNMDFEQSNAELSAVLGKSKTDIAELTEQAKHLGATTLFTANEISQLQISLARLGFNQTEIKQSTAAVSQLALATGVDLKDAATLTGSTLRAFGYDASEAARVASVLGVSTTKSALDMEKLKTAMGYASSVARQAGFHIEDVVAMLGKMVDNGQQATTAGVNLRNIFLDLSNKSSKLSQAIKKVTGKDQISSFEEFVLALRQMRAEGINLDDVANVVQKRVTPGFLNMIANTEGIIKLRDELKGCTGELEEMANKMTDTLQGSITLLKSAWDGLMLSFNSSNSSIKSAVDSLTKLLNSVREMKETGQLKYDLQSIAIEIKAVTAAFLALKAQSIASAVWGTITAAVTKLNKAIQILNATIMRNPYAAAGAAIIALTVAVYNLSKRSREAAGNMSEAATAMDEVKKTAETVTQTVGDVLGKFTALQTEYINLKTNDEKSKWILENAGAFEELGLQINKVVDADRAFVTGSAKVIQALQSRAIANAYKDMYEEKAKKLAREQASDTYYRPYRQGADINLLPDELKNEIIKKFGGQTNGAYVMPNGQVEGNLGKLFGQKLDYANEYEANRVRAEKEARIAQLKEDFDSFSKLYLEAMQKANEDIKNAKGLVASTTVTNPSTDLTKNPGLNLNGDDDDTDKVKDYTDRMLKAEARYANKLELASINIDQGVEEKKDYLKKELAATEQLRTSYAELYEETKDPKYLDEMKGLAEAIKCLRQEIDKQTELEKQAAEKLKQQQAQQSFNKRILRGLESYTRKAGVSFGDVGMTDELQQAALRGDIIDWQPIVDNLNKLLAKYHFQIAVDLDSGSIEKLKDQIIDALKAFQDKLSNVSTVVNGIDNIKQSSEDLISTLMSEEDAWDKMFSLINWGIGLMQTIVSIQEAINTLKNISTTLSYANAAAMQMETQAAATETGVQAGLTTVKAGNSVAGIPGVGPILAVAAIGAVLAAILAAVSSAKSAGNYSNGGIIPGNSPTGDKLIAHVNSGEGILTANGVRNLGALYAGQGYGAMNQNIRFEIEGTKLIGVTNNTIRAKGGKNSNLIYQH